MSPRFLYVTPGVWELPHSLFASEAAYFSICEVFVDDKANGGWFLFYWRLLLLWVMAVGFDNT